MIKACLISAVAVLFFAQATPSFAEPPTQQVYPLAQQHLSHKKLQPFAGNERLRHGPRTLPGQFSGKASYYWQGQRVASGGSFDPKGYTAAHRTLPFGTKVRVTDPRSKRTVIVTINDRGPFTGGRILDLSLGAAEVLGMTGRGVIEIVADVM